MYKSKELRWFTQTESTSVLQWFSRFGLQFSTVQPRTDFYLPIPNNNSLNIKLREGNIEIKQRSGTPLSFQWMNQATGYLEEWVKWSFGLNGSDPLATAITQSEIHEWIEVLKERVAVKIMTDADRKLKIYPLQKELSFGCQLEYTRLTIDGTIWYTFAVEWFGNSFLDINEIAELPVIGEAVLSIDNSCGYNEFFNRNRLYRK